MEEMPPNFVTHEEFAPVKDTVTRIQHFMFGNGDPGWDEVLRDIKKYVDEQRTRETEKAKDRRDSQKHYLRLTIGTAITTIVILAINGIIWFVRILPVLNQLATAPTPKP